jgi:hypothetical protein
VTKIVPVKKFSAMYSYIRHNVETAGGGMGGEKLL